jgi:capsular polysaccharide biosynthesis protein
MKMKPPNILKRLVRRFGLLILITLLGAIAGAIYGEVKKPSYSAQSYVVVTGEPGEPVTALNFAQAYGRITTKGPVADRAAALLGSRRGLNQVTASTSPDAPVIEITATGTGAKQTADVANAVARGLVEYGTQRKDQTRVNLAVLATASVPASPSAPKPPLELAVGAAGGLLIGGLSLLAGGGGRAEDRSAASESAEATRYVFDGSSPTRIAADEYAPKSITSYSEAAAPKYDEPSDAADPADPPPAIGRVVASAIVYREPS